MRELVYPLPTRLTHNAATGGLASTAAGPPTRPPPSNATSPSPASQDLTYVTGSRAPERSKHKTETKPSIRSGPHGKHAQPLRLDEPRTLRCPPMKSHG